jgi:hypothetical protein
MVGLNFTHSHVLLMTELYEKTMVIFSTFINNFIDFSIDKFIQFRMELILHLLLTGLNIGRT